MRILGIIWFSLLVSCGGSRDARPADSMNKMEDCLLFYRNQNWQEALDCLDHFPDNLRNQAFHDLQGTVYQKIGNETAAVMAFQKAIQKDSTNQNLFLHFKLGESLWRDHKYLEAGQAFQKFHAMAPNPKPDIQKKLDYYLRSYAFAEQSYQHPRSFQLAQLPDQINSPDQELGVSLTFDRRTLVFTRRKHQEDLYISHEREGHWTTAYPIRELNTRDNEGAAAISGDGQSLVFTACNRPDGMGSCDIFLSVKSDTGWTKPSPVPNVNSVYWDSQPTLSPDGRAMIFSSERPGGYGGRDLWLTVQNEDNRWIQPLNLGPAINSPGNEENPHLHTDEQTLYFTSDYWPGFGGRDIFMSHRLQGNNWSDPENLGYPINSPDHEEGVFIVSSGEKGYMASERAGQFDLYSFVLDPAIQPRRAFLYQLIVLNKNNGHPVNNARIRVLDWKENKEIRKGGTDEEGYVAFLMRADKIYAANIEHENFGFNSFQLYSDQELSQDRIDTVYLQPIERNQSIVLENVLFETGKAQLQTSAYFELDQLVAFLKKNPKLNILLTGHTDNTGNTEDNLLLSRQRAAAVKTYLVQQGINEERIETTGKGESEPITSNDTPEGRQKNRRTEMTIQ